MENIGDLTRSTPPWFIGTLSDMSKDFVSIAVNESECSPRVSKTTEVRITDIPKALWSGQVIRFGETAIAMVQTPPGYTGKSARMISIGSDMERVREQYGCPVRTRETRGGRYYVYDDAKVIIITDTDDRVTGWMIYGITGAGER
jgi:hypothetical protein